MVSFTLSEAGFQVIEGANGAEALAALKGRTVDLIVTDLNMPNLDGIGLIRGVRADPSHKFIPIILLTTDTPVTPECFKDVLALEHVAMAYQLEL